MKKITLVYYFIVYQTFIIGASAP